MIESVDGRLSRRRLLAAGMVAGAAALLPGATGRERARAAGAKPDVAYVPRARWDRTDACRPAGPPELARAVRRIYVHHTNVLHDYDPGGEAAAAVRTICRSHVAERGFDDLGYNFVIDHYGRVYEGRAGGPTAAVVGAHAAGFNHGSVGIALLGDFERNHPTAASIAALDELMAWLADLHGIDPLHPTRHVSTGGATTIHPAGTVVELPAIVGHRATATDSLCPGRHLHPFVETAPERVDAILTDRYGWADAATRRRARTMLFQPLLRSLRWALRPA